MTETTESGGNRQDVVFAGVVIGIVSDNQDPDAMGRVKVTFPWRGEDDESNWARIATLMAGHDRGSFFLPEVGDEVLVAFEHGDIRHPCVLGALWGGVDKPPEDNADGENNIRTIKSRSGHQIIFDDSDGSEKLEIQTNAGHKIVLDDSSGSECIEIVDKTGDNFIKMDSAQNSIEIESASEFRIKSQTIEIEADTTINVKAGATLTIEGAMVEIN